MKNFKLMTIVGTRPEIIRLSRVIACFEKNLDHILVHTGQNFDYELSKIFFEDLEIKSPDYFLETAGETSIQIISNVLIKVDEILEREKPDAVLVLGDTNSCLCQLSAKRRKIPTFHIEAGNRCFDMRVPEEINRKLVDHVADVNLTYSSIAREYLMREGLPQDLVIKVGSPMYEVLEYNKNKIENSKVLEKLNLNSNKYFLVSAHREENIEPDVKFKKFIEVLNLIAEKYQFPIIFSTHPRTRKRIIEANVFLDERIRILKPLNFTDYNKLQIQSKVVLSDSGTINEEAAILNFPALNLRDSHERPEGMEEAVVMMVGFDKERIFQALNILEKQPKGKNRLIQKVIDYSHPLVSEKVLRIVFLSYTNYVNQIVWKKY